MTKKKLNATSFQMKVWKAIKAIPLGQTRSYKELAIHIGYPKAARAVANACAKNPDPSTIPCHRVICSDGSIGGYSLSGGSKKKLALLKKELKLAKSIQVRTSSIST